MRDQPTVILDDADRHALVFEAPQRIIIADRPADLDAAFDAIEAAVAQGQYVAGYISYEAGYVLEARLAALLPSARPAPLMWFGVFDQPRRVADADVIDSPRAARAYAGTMRVEWDELAYERRYARVAEWIAAGDIFQANLSMRARFRVVGAPSALYRHMRAHARVPYGAYIDDGKRQILSFSPELFIDVDADGHIRSKPMKGTAPRAADPNRDAALRDELAASAKNRAENLMIVDLIRNDLSRIASPGSVTVPSLFAVETFPTVHQMVSTVGADLTPGLGARDIVRAIFPCGSITGAPKIRAMEIIRALESSPRGVYCGAIGYFAPDRSATFNVAIRTVTIQDGYGEFGIGGGVVADSRAASEYEECLIKARFFTGSRVPIRLVETIRAERGHLVRLAMHLDRIAAAARDLDILFDRSRAELLLAEHARAAIAATYIQLVLADDGRLSASSHPAPAPAIWRYAISATRVDSDDPLLRYDSDWRTTRDPDVAALIAADRIDDALFLNERDELTQGARSTLYVRRGGTLLTPPLASGLVDDCLRRTMIDAGEAREAVLTCADLESADAVFLGNSAMGLMDAVPADVTTRATDPTEEPALR